MSYFANELKLQNDLRELIDNTLALRETTIVSKDFEGTAHYSDALMLLDRTMGVLEELRDCDFSDAPPDYLSNHLINTVSPCYAVVKGLCDFTATGSSGGPSAFGSHVSQLYARYTSSYPNMRQAVALFCRPPMLKLAATKVKQQLKESQNTLNKMVGMQSAFEQWIENKETSHADLLKQYSDEQADLKQQSVELLQQMRDIAGEVGTKHHAIRFQNEAKQQLQESCMWLLLGGAIAGWLIYYSHALEGSLTLILKQHGLAYMWPILASKTIVLSIASFGLFLCGRNYSAARHNHVVNKHRQNALSTFEIFVSSQDADEDTKKAVLLETTKAIFSAHPSGYLKAADENNPSAQIIEFVRNTVTGTKDK